MSTNATVAIKLKSGRILGIYNHWDGYPSHLLHILVNHYCTYESVLELLASGDISSSDKNTGDVDYFINDKQYHRPWHNHIPIKARTHRLFVLGYGEQYNYLFINGKWKMRKGGYVSNRKKRT